MFVAWVVFHVIICIGLVLVVLLQSSKGEGLAGSAFGGGGGGISGAVFGGRGAASFLSKATTVLAITFMLNCLVLAFMSANTVVTTTGGGDPGNTESVVTQQAQQERDEYLARQQQQAQQAGDTAAGNPLINVQPMPADTSGN